MTERDIKSYIKSWGLELTAKADRVRNLIGDAHWLSDGRHKEFLIKGFLQKYLSDSYLIENGFICPSDDKGEISGEIDIIVADPTIQPPWFNENDLIIVPPSSVRAHIHVKSTFSSTSLKDVMQSAIKGYKSLSNIDLINPVWSCGIFFHKEENKKMESVVGTIERAISSLSPNDYMLTERMILPRMITLVNHGVVIIQYDSSSKIIKLRGFDTGDLSSGVFLANLWEAINKDTVAGDLEKLIPKLNLDNCCNKNLQVKV